MNDRELDQAVRQWERLAHKIVHRYKRHAYETGLTYEDLLQEARIGIFKGLRDFDPARRVPLTSFLAIMGSRDVRKALDSATCGKQRHLNQAMSTVVRRDGDEDSILDSLEGDPMDRPDHAAERTDEREGAAAAIRAALERAGLTPSEKAYLDAVLDGGSYNEIGAEFGVTGQAIHMAMKRVQQKLAWVFEVEREAA